MSRKLCKLKIVENVLGAELQLVQDDQVVTTLQMEQSDTWRKFNKLAPENYYWFRAPAITQSQLQDTVNLLTGFTNVFEFRVWADGDKLDASLKLTDEGDAAMIAWSMNGIWNKWSTPEEAELKASRKPVKPLRVRVLKDGTIKVKGKVQVTQVDATTD